MDDNQISLATFLNKLKDGTFSTERAAAIHNNKLKEKPEELIEDPKINNEKTNLTLEVKPIKNNLQKLQELNSSFNEYKNFSNFKKKFGKKPE